MVTVGRILRWIGIGLVVSMTTIGCRSDKRAAAPTSTTPPPVIVTAQRTDLMFTFVDAGGAFHDVTRVDEVPEASRGQVIVRDLSRSPDELGAADYLYVADLRSADAEGRYPCGPVSRHRFGRQAVAQAAVEAAKQDPDSAPVTVFSTEWCGVCKQAKAFLKDKGVPFVDRDIEKDPQAAALLQTKATAAGIEPQGVPVIDVRGRLLMGFDPRALVSALDAQKIPHQ